MNKFKTMYEVREFIGNEYSKQLGKKLRSRQDALRISKMLKKQGRSIYIASIKVIK